MFRTWCVQHQEDCIVHALLYVMFLPDAKHMMFETCRRHEELNSNTNLKECAFYWLTLHKNFVLLTIFARSHQHKQYADEPDTATFLLPVQHSISDVIRYRHNNSLLLQWV